MANKKIDNATENVKKTVGKVGKKAINKVGTVKKQAIQIKDDFIDKAAGIKDSIKLCPGIIEIGKRELENTKAKAGEVVQFVIEQGKEAVIKALDVTFGRKEPGEKTIIVEQEEQQAHEESREGK